MATQKSNNAGQESEAEGRFVNLIKLKTQKVHELGILLDDLAFVLSPYSSNIPKGDTDKEPFAPECDMDEAIVGLDGEIDKVFAKLEYIINTFEG